MQQPKCPRCFALLPVRARRTFLGFSRRVCQACGFAHIEPLSTAYRRAYWGILVVIAIALIEIAMRGFIPVLGGQGLLIVIGAIVALRTDRRLRRAASLEASSVSPSLDKVMPIGQPSLGHRLVTAPRRLTTRSVIILGLAVALAIVLFPPWQIRVITRTKTAHFPSIPEVVGMAYGATVDTVTRIAVDTLEWTLPFASIFSPPEVDFVSFRKRAAERIRAELSAKGADSLEAMLLESQQRESEALDRARVPPSLRTERFYFDTVGGREYDITKEDGFAREIAYERLIFMLLATALVTSIAALTLKARTV